METYNLEASARTIASIVGSITHKTDEIFSAAISNFLGTSEWSIADLGKRARIDCYKGGTQELIVDGVLLVRVRPIDYLHERTSDGVNVSAKVFYETTLVKSIRQQSIY